MYGNQMKIVAVNGDIGVKGDVISERVLKINADGTVVTNRTQAKEAIEVKAKEFTQNTSAMTEGNLTIEADKAVLKGNVTQAGNILITGDLENEVNIYSGTDINIGKGLLNTSGQIVAERNLLINGKTDNKDLLYAKGNITVGKELSNTGTIQSNSSIRVGGNTSNTGKILTEDEVTINGRLTSSGTVYGKTKHLGYNEYERSTNTNSGNGKKTKVLRSKYGEIPISVPQDRESTFDPKIVSKRTKDISGIEEKIISMYTRGLSTR
jgi:filamentous hemagglutinin